MGLRPRQRLYPKELGSMRLHDPMTKWPLFGQIWRLGGANHINSILDVSRVLGARSQGPWLGRGSQAEGRNSLGRGWPGQWGPGFPKGEGGGLLTCQLVSGRPEICIRNMVRRGRGATGRSDGAPGKFSLRRGPRANCTVNLSPLKSLPSADGW